MNESALYETLARIDDPKLGEDIVSLGVVTDIHLDGETTNVEVALHAPHAPDERWIATAIRDELEDAGLERDLELSLAPESTRHEGPTPDVKNVIAVSSGKGGVGKTTVAVNLATALADRGARVGILDGDVYGPNVPRVLGVEGAPTLTDDERIVPPEHEGVKVLSIGQLVPEDEAAVLRGPMVDSLLQRLLTETEWAPLDYLVVDLPPGTGDAQLTLCQTVDVTGAVVVTTPQRVAIDDARRNLSMFGSHGIPVLGIVENMRTFECTSCGDHHDLFGNGGGDELAREYDVPFLGALPIDQDIRVDGDEGSPVALGDGASARAFETLAGNTADAVGALRRRDSALASSVGEAVPADESPIES
ncbi:Mrp/NBP35 family ATP-binding protein [Natronorubrum daqingense]|uniref:Iron-sulfur cluster carrier protein n=1 Tax=Natronorubrum daqingense TaxID=588898 RepID=A0A1N7DVQ7_9EURY|nr:Mrp/NBP35 family ATP-binding protein [Natronorubrum daqingense]APX96203.1 MRP family ATP-binding protein [Natronorubrum daqingense]SIR79878.1 ATP-binding protein involved in chromosome partitioning [Natronorubrum daqingense]